MEPQSFEILSKEYLKHCQTSMIEHFWESS